MNEVVRTGQPVVIGKLTITPIERVRVNSGTGSMGFWVYAYKEPVGIVIDSPDGQRIIDSIGQEPVSEGLGDRTTL